MHTEPLVSVCVPTYNDGEFLAQSLQSIVAQTYHNLEIIVGDDASIDNTTDIVCGFDDSRIRYYRNSKNLGQFENVNHLVQQAKGQYVAVYHSDDVYTPQIIEKQVNFLQAHPEAGAIFAMNWRMNELGEITGQSKLLKEVSTATCLELADVLPVLLQYKNWLLIGPTFMGRSEVFQKVGFFSSNFSIAGDFEMWLRILTTFKIAVLDEPLMYYRQGSTQVSYGYQYLRTFEEHFFTIVDHYLADESLANRLDRTVLTEYTFHRRDDETFRAANYVIQGKVAQAEALLQHPYPWRTFLTSNLWKRKLRVLLLRTLIQVGLTFGMIRSLARVLLWTEYGRPFSSTSELAPTCQKKCFDP